MKAILLVYENQEVVEGRNEFLVDQFISGDMNKTEYDMAINQLPEKILREEVLFFNEKDIKYFYSYEGNIMIHMNDNSTFLLKYSEQVLQQLEKLFI